MNLKDVMSSQVMMEKTFIENFVCLSVLFQVMVAAIGIVEKLKCQGK